jgi:hypothetical protein
MSNAYEAVVYNEDTSCCCGVGRGSDIPGAIADSFGSAMAERAGSGEFSLEVYRVSDEGGETDHYDRWLRDQPESMKGPNARGVSEVSR